MICPYCKEEIKEGALICKFCKSILNDNSQVGDSAPAQIKITERPIDRLVIIEKAHELCTNGESKNAYDELKRAGNIKSLIESNLKLYFWMFELIMGLEKEDVDDIQIKKFSNDNFPKEWQIKINEYFSNKTKQNLILRFRNQLEVAKKKNALDDELESINHLISYGEKEYLERKFIIEELLNKKKKKRLVYIGAFITILLGIPLAYYIYKQIDRKLYLRAYSKQEIAYNKASKIGTIDSFSEFLNTSSNTNISFRDYAEKELKRLCWEKGVGRENILNWWNLMKQANRELDNVNVRAAQSLLEKARSIKESDEIDKISARLEPFLLMEKIMSSGNGELNFLLAKLDDKYAYSKLSLSNGYLGYYIYGGGSTSDKFIVALTDIDLISMQSNLGNSVIIKTKIANQIRFSQLEEFNGPRVFYEGRRDSFSINTKGRDESTILRKLLSNLIQPNPLP